MGLLEGKKALVFGIANDKSIAYGIAKRFREEGAEVAISYAIPQLERRVTPIAQEVGSKFCVECDLGNDEAIKNLATQYEKEIGKVDILVHSVAYASREALSGRFLDVTREDFKGSLDISVYTLLAVVKAFEHMMDENSSILTLTYYGAEKVVPNYNVMGVAKAALEAAVRYMAQDIGRTGKRVNAISAGPVKTLSAAGITGFRSMLPSHGERAPLGRNIDIEDCGDLAVFLSSKMARNITGEVVHVDAGYNILGF